MTFKDSAISIIKSPFTWISLSILGVIIAIVIIIHHHSSGGAGCPAGQITMCGGRCVDPCEEGKSYDCTTNECGCPDGTAICKKGIDGNLPICCPNDECINDLCCPSKQQCGGKCCPSGQLCGPDNKTCGDGCKGPDGLAIVCPADKSTCLTVSNLTDAQFDDFKKQFGNDVVGTKASASVCASKPACTLSDEIAAPHTIDSTYLCTGIFQLDAAGKRAYCTSDTVTDAKACWLKGVDETGTTSNCSGGTCIIRYPLEAGVTTDTVSQDIMNITEGVDHTDTTYYGSWCGEENNLSYMAQETADAGAICNAAHCWSQLDKLNTIDVSWDEDTKTCSTISQCNAKDPTSFGVKDASGACPDSSTNPICKDTDNYSCNGDGSVTKAYASGWSVDTTTPGGQLTDCKLMKGGSGIAVFDTKLECINDACTKNKDCCANGFNFNNGACYQEASTGWPGCSNTSCSASGGECGPAWRANCDKSGAKCNSHCCNDGHLDGGGPPGGAIIPTCVCQKNSGGNWARYAVNVYRPDGDGCWGHGDGPQCTPDQHNDDCLHGAYPDPVPPPAP